MTLPQSVSSLLVSASLVFIYHVISTSGANVVWLSSFTAIIALLSRLPHIPRVKTAPHDATPIKGHAASVLTSSALFVTLLMSLAVLGVLRFTVVMLTVIGLRPISQLKGNRRMIKLTSSFFCCITVVLISNPSRAAPRSPLFEAAGVLSAVLAAHLSSKQAFKDANARSFVFSAFFLGVVGFTLTLLLQRPAADNEMTLLGLFCFSSFVISMCQRQESLSPTTASQAFFYFIGVLFASLVCGENVFPSLYSSETVAFAAGAALLYFSQRGLSSPNSKTTALNTTTFNPAQMFKRSKGHQSARGLGATLLSNSRECKLFIFLLLTVAIMLLEFLYGMATNSLSLISDSFHMMLDGMSIAIGLYAAHAASRLPDEKTHPFGYARYEIFGGFVNGVLLLFIALYVILESIQRMMDPPEIKAPYLLLVSVIGLAVNIVGVFFFHDTHGHSHSHSHEGGCSHVDHNMRGVYLHILADLLGSVSVIVSSLLISFFGWWIADPICSAVSAILIFLSALPLLEETGKLLVLSAPNYDRNYTDELRQAIHETGCLQDVEAPKIWIQSTPPRELTICTVAGKLRRSGDYQTSRKIIVETVTAHIMHRLGAHNVSVFVHLE